MSKINIGLIVRQGITIILFCIVALAFIVFLDRWRAERRELAAAFSNAGKTISDLTGGVETVMKRLTSLSEGFAAQRALLEELRKQQSEILERLTDNNQESGAVSKSSSKSKESAEALVESPQNIELEAVPDRFTPVLFSEKELEELLKDEYVNPQGIEVSRVQFARAHVALTNAQSRIRVLSSEMQLELATGMEVLRERAEYIEYPQGTPPPAKSDPRVLTIAETDKDGAARWYALYPEEFPQLYEKRFERVAVTRRAIAEVAAIIRGQ